MNKALIIPILALIALVIKSVSGYEIPQEALDITANAALSIVTLIGIFMHPVKPEAGTDASQDGK